MSDNDLGPLAAALAKAQAAFPAVVRDKHVTVTSKTGASYAFDYAPLDSILAATRAPLCDNGLALVQILDDGALVTRLIHESGASLTGRVDLPQTGTIQELGSAITYLRRYAVQAVLGIAAEDDDDGNRAIGGSIKPRDRKPSQPESAEQPAAHATPDGGLIGTVAIGNAWLEDCEVRQTPEGPVLGFRLKSGRQHQKVEARGPMAVALGGLGTDLIGQTVTCWGSMVQRSFTPKGTDREVDYQVMRVERVHGPSFDIPALDAAHGALAASGAALCPVRSPWEGSAECALPEGHAGNHRSSEKESW